MGFSLGPAGSDSQAKKKMLRRQRRKFMCLDIKADLELKLDLKLAPEK